MATTTAALICPQGHGPGNPGTRFCTWCGTQLIPPVMPGQQPLVTTVQNPVQMSVQVAPVAQPQPILPVLTQPVAGPEISPAPALPTSFVVPVPAAAPACTVCGDGGLRLSPEDDVCSQCGWLRPLYPGFQLNPAVFLWAQDGQAMSKLQSISTLHSAVRFASDRVGRPWIESTFNGIRLGPRQMPHIWKTAVVAARILGLPKMPDIYISGGSGGSMWDTFTFGSDQSSFIVLGSSILLNFEREDLLFVLAREMGHCRAGHAVWKSVIRFLAGDNSQSGLLSNGLLKALSPSKLVEGAIEIPLMMWSRQSEITADRAGFLAVGSEALARNVLLASSLRSARLIRQVSIEEWMKQEDTSDDQLTRFSEMTTSASMYTTRRLRLLGQAAREASLMQWSQHIQEARKRLPPLPAPPLLAAPRPRAAPQPTAPPAPRVSAPADSIRVICAKCQTGMRIPFSVLRGKPFLNVRCPQCRNVTTLRPKPAAASAPPTPAPAPAKPAAPLPTGAAK